MSTLADILAQIKWYGKRGIPDPGQGFDDSHPVITNILDKLVPITKPMVDAGSLAREIAPRMVSSGPIQSLPPQMQDTAKKVATATIEGFGDFVGESSSPLNIASLLAGGAGGFAKGGFGKAFTAALNAGFIPPAVTMMESGDPSGTAFAVLPLAVLLKNPGLAQKYPEQAYKSIAQTMNELPPFITRETLRDSLNFPGGYGLKYEGLANDFSSALNQGLETPIGRALWGLRLYIHGGPGLNAIKIESKNYIAGGVISPSNNYASWQALYGISENQILSIPGNRTSELAAAVVDSIRAAKPEKIKLYRGLSEPFSYRPHMEYEKLKDAKIGDIISIGDVSSFSTSQSVSRDFQYVGGVLLETRGPIKRLNVSPLSHYREGESLSFGNFRIVKVADEIISGLESQKKSQSLLLQTLGYKRYSSGKSEKGTRIIIEAIQQ